MTRTTAIPLLHESAPVAANEPMLSPEMLALAKAIANVVLDGVRADLADLLRRPSPLDNGHLPTTQTEWLTASEAARHLGMNIKAFYTAVERRQVPASRLGRRLRFNRVGLDRLLQQRQRRVVQQTPRVPSPGKESERW
jgi:excisionase family DNA binding protein